MYNPFKNWSDGLKTGNEGWSGRKQTALALTLCFLAAHAMWFNYALAYRDFSLFINVLIIDLVGIAFFLGLVTVQNIIELRTGKSSSIKETTTVEKEIEVKP